MSLVQETRTAEAHAGRESFRPDIEGLRAVAVALVMLYHAGVPAFAGGYVGVDVFFVISGYLITGVIVRELEATGRLRLGRFYRRRARRLLPAVAVNLAGIGALTMLALPTLRRSGIATDLRWSALYAVNWRFADGAVDYLAEGQAASPLQHYWSLAVEEQFYVMWPVLLAAIAVLSRRMTSTVRGSIGIGIAVSIGASFGTSLWLTSSEPARAYFVTTTRVWELAIGGALAVAVPQVRRVVNGNVASALALGGAIAVVLSALWYDDGTSFPGSAALLPVLGTVAVIAAGVTDRRHAVFRVLATAPMCRVGALSYALYLWHWPLVVVAGAHVDDVTPLIGILAVSASVVPAVLSHRFVEQPIRRSEASINPPWRGLALAALCTMVGLGTAAVVEPSVPGTVVSGTNVAAGSGRIDQPARSVPLLSEPRSEASSSLPSSALGIAESSSSVAAGDAPSAEPGPALPKIATVQAAANRITPDPLAARADIPSVYGDECHSPREGNAVLSCRYGRPGGSPVVAIVGDSHAAQWVPTLQEVATDRGFELRTYTKSGCQFADVVQATADDEKRYVACDEWNAELFELLTGNEGPDLVIATGVFWPTLLDADGALIDRAETAEVLAKGLVRRWTELLDAGVPVAVIRDVPYPRIDVAECVADHRDRLVDCAVDRSEATTGNTAHLAAADALGLPFIDLTDHLCAPDLCPAVIDDLLVWRDRHHLTATYARRLAPLIDDWLGPVLDSIRSGSVSTREVSSG